MNRCLLAPLFLGIIVIAGGCSENIQEAKVEKKSVQNRNSRVLLSSRKLKAERLMPVAAELGDEWIEVDKEIVIEQVMAKEGSGSTAAVKDRLLSSYSEEVVNSAGSAKVIARFVFSHYDVEEPVALSLTWIIRGEALQPFSASDLFTLNRLYGFSEWKLGSNGVAYAFPTGDVAKETGGNMFEVKTPVAAYLAVDGCLIEVRCTSDLPAREFMAAFDKVKSILGNNVSSKIAGVECKPEDIKRYWDILQKIML